MTRQRSLAETIVMCGTTQAPPASIRPDARRMRRARRWVCKIAGRWQSIPPRKDWHAYAVEVNRFAWSTFRSAVRISSDPAVEMLGFVTDERDIVPVDPVEVRRMVVGVKP